MYAWTLDKLKRATIIKLKPYIRMGVELSENSIEKIGNLLQNHLTKLSMFISPIVFMYFLYCVQQMYHSHYTLSV